MRSKKKKLSRQKNDYSTIEIWCVKTRRKQFILHVIFLDLKLFNIHTLVTITNVPANFMMTEEEWMFAFKTVVSAPRAIFNIRRRDNEELLGRDCVSRVLMSSSRGPWQFLASHLLMSRLSRSLTKPVLVSVQGPTFFSTFCHLFGRNHTHMVKCHGTFPKAKEKYEDNRNIVQSRCKLSFWFCYNSRISSYFLLDAFSNARNISDVSSVILPRGKTTLHGISPECYRLPKSAEAAWS